MNRLVIILCLIAVAAACTGGKQETLIAIDVLIQPGPKVMAEAEKWNARMREQSPEGFELDEEHAPLSWVTSELLQNVWIKVYFFRERESVIKTSITG
jgi:hypothetical protein